MRVHRLLLPLTYRVACSAVLLFLTSCSTHPPRPTQQESFTNPILPAPSPDPWMLQEGDTYLLCESRDRSIVLRRAGRLTAIREDPGRTVWTAPASGPYSDEIWAPEIHRIDGRWYIYFAADDGQNAHHRMWVIASEGSNPYGPYGPCTQLATGGWAIDGTILQNSEGALFFIWSGWPGTADGLQQLYIAPMSSPTALGGKRVLLASPTEPWERHAMPICEGPASLQHGGRTFLVYSASGSWTREYCLGMLINEDGNFLSASSWQKVGPVFAGTATVFGVGHCSFVHSPDGLEDWIVYHAKERAEDGWEDRSARAQKFAWDQRGLPLFGRPVSPGVALTIPSESQRQGFR